MNRSKSSSYSAYSSSDETRSRRRHKSAVHFQQPIMSVSLKSLKVPQPEKQTMTEHVSTSSNSEKIHREIDDLKRALNEKNEIISRQHDQCKQIADLKSNEMQIFSHKTDSLNKQVEEQKNEILSLKNKLGKNSFFAKLF